MVGRAIVVYLCAALTMIGASQLGACLDGSQQLDAAAAIETSAGAAISSACSAAYGRAGSDAAALERTAATCHAAMDAYDAHEAARRTLAALLDAGASEADVAAAQAALVAAGAGLTAAVAGLGSLGRVR